MKNTYQKPASEVMNLGLKGEMLADVSIDVMSISATHDETKQIDGGDALVKDGGAWDIDGLWN